ncbi:hypothetical protein LBMAG42_05200 [Deltaproteobacteria bacterium]|nr:hypothetical protein LBMAG42_05200 [Deltaproteobacteria bacterium]
MGAEGNAGAAWYPPFVPLWIPLVAMLVLIWGWWARTAFFVLKQPKSPEEEEQRRTIGGAIQHIARVQGLGPLAGSSADLGPPPADPVDDDAHTYHMDAPPRPPEE